MQAGLDFGRGGVDPRCNTVELWSAALARRDGAEVDRLVRQSRVDRICAAASGQLGTMLG